MADVAVIGAGVVGMTAALALRREGHRVVVFDPDPPGAGCSHGNAGGITPSGVVPVGTPGVIAGLPRMLRDPLAPLAIRPSYLPALAPWLLRFLRASTPGRVATISGALASVLRHVVADWETLLGSLGAEALMKKEGLLYAYATKASFEGALEGFAIRRAHGYEVTEVDRAELHRRVPCLAPAFDRGLLVPACAHIVDPRRVVETVAAAFRQEGGELRAERAAVSAEGAALHVSAAGRRERFERIVVAAGAFSRPLAAALGARVPLETERGYHLMLPAPGIDVPVPMMSGEGKFAVTPMAGGLRLAGTVELAGLRAPPDWRRAEMLLKGGRAMFPGLRDDGAVRWMGFRPSLPDSLPVIGPVPRQPGAILAFGHGHLGLTLAATTARLVADCVAGRPPAVDLRPFRADRF